MAQTLLNLRAANDGSLTSMTVGLTAEATTMTQTAAPSMALFNVCFRCH